MAINHEQNVSLKKKYNPFISSGKYTLWDRIWSLAKLHMVQEELFAGDGKYFFLELLNTYT